MMEMDKETQPVSHKTTEDTDNVTTTDSTIWGLLIWASARNLDAIRLTQDKDLYIVGRGTSCDIVIQQDMTKVKVDNLSRLHCGFRRVQESTDMSRIYLEDYSSNGTFVNGALVGKGNKKILSNGDKIYMACKKGKVFTYLDPQQPKTGFPAKANI